jgi:hypothetical protein
MRVGVYALSQPKGSPCTVDSGNAMWRLRVLDNGGMPRARERRLRRVALGEERAGPVRPARLLHVIVHPKAHGDEVMIAVGATPNGYLRIKARNSTREVLSRSQHVAVAAASALSWRRGV